MGGLHKGHEILIKRAKRKNKNTLVSIFVNPKQFNSKNDFLSYPRNFKKDVRILKKLKVKYLYCPTYNDICPLCNPPIVGTKDIPLVFKISF